METSQPEGPDVEAAIRERADLARAQAAVVEGWYDLGQRCIVRSSPSLSALTVGTLSFGARVNVCEPSTVRGGVIFVRIRARYGGATQALVGWLCGEDFEAPIGFVLRPVYGLPLLGGGGALPPGD